MLDKNKDKRISLEEINLLTEGEIEFAAKLFPMYMSEEDEIENENESESENQDENRDQGENENENEDDDEELLPMGHQKKTEL